MVYELFLIVGLPVLIMALTVIVQPTRFEIDEESGCASDMYSYVGYLSYGPQLTSSLGCVILAPLTLRAFLRHRKEMNEYLSSSQDITYSKYSRLMVVACLDTLFNLPVSITIIITEILEGKGNALNNPYISWKNVHDGEGGNAPGLSLSSILQIPASEWSSGGRWSVLAVKWDEWIYVLHAITFFLVFGTTPEMRRYYRTAFWFIPERLGYKRWRVSEVETLSDVMFNSNPVQQTETHLTENSSRGTSSFPETDVDKSVTHSKEMVEGNDLESGMTAGGTHFVIETVIFVEGDENRGAVGR